MKAELEELLRTSQLAQLGPGPRAGVMEEAAIRKAFARIQPGGTDTLLALLLLWHDHHEPAHEIVQDIETADGSYVHAILHRREPDYGNAKYWFRRVGTHPAYAELGRQVAERLKTRDGGRWASSLALSGSWDAMAFVDACAAGLAKPSEPDTALLQEIQQIEFVVLAGYLAEG